MQWDHPRVVKARKQPNRIKILKNLKKSNTIKKSSKQESYSLISELFSRIGVYWLAQHLIHLFIHLHAWMIIFTHSHSLCPESSSQHSTQMSAEVLYTANTHISYPFNFEVTVHCNLLCSRNREINMVLPLDLLRYSVK